jgi:hypothetical protein
MRGFYKSAAAGGASLATLTPSWGIESACIFKEWSYLIGEHEDIF